MVWRTWPVSSTDVNAKNNERNIPLTQACKIVLEDMANVLIVEKADVNAKTNHGDTPLTLACDKGLEDVARLLIENGADVDAKNDHGDTPLIGACLEGHEDVARLLIEKGAGMNARNDDRHFSLLSALHRLRSATSRTTRFCGPEIARDTPFKLSSWYEHNNYDGEIFEDSDEN